MWALQGRMTFIHSFFPSVFSKSLPCAQCHARHWGCNGELDHRVPALTGLTLQGIADHKEQRNKYKNFQLWFNIGSMGT